MRWPACAGLLVAGWLAAVSAAAHPLDPALLELRQAPDGTVEVRWQVPAAQPRGAPLTPVLPGSCRQLEPPALSRDGVRVAARWTVDCGGESLAGARVGVAGLRERETDALVRVRLADGRLVQGVVRGGEPFLTVPERAGAAEVFRVYLGLGFEHILGGLDHLAFVLGLVLLVRGRRSLLRTVTAFTAGHSLTLSLAALGFVRVPAAKVEVLIAVSILAVAVELTRPERGRAVSRWRSPWAMAGAFGLLHGLGFAGALAQVGLPEGEIPTALFSFNCGIELGQLLFVAALLLAGSGLRAAGKYLPRVSELPPRVLRSAAVPAYGIGTLAAYWVFERLWVLF